MKIGDRIKQKRTELDLSQSDLSRACGWGEGRNRVSNYESNIREPNSLDVIKLAKSLNCDPGWLLFGTKETSSTIKIATQAKSVPVIKMEDTQKFLKGKLTNFSTMAYISANEKFYNRENLFFVTVVGDSMSSPEDQKKSCFDGDLALIDPNLLPKEGDLVLMTDGESIKIRKLSKDGTENILIPFNKQYPIIKLKKSVSMLGVVLMIQKIITDR